MSGVEGVVTEVLRAHQYASDHSGGSGWRCLGDDCTAGGVWDEEYDAHVAACIVQALGLTEEVSVRVGGVAGLVMSRAEAEEKPEQRHIIATRWLSSWVAVERGEQ